MPQIQGEILIERPVEEVFDFVADECNEPAYNREMLRAEKVSRGPIGIGSRFSATVRSGGRPVEMDIEFTSYDRPRRLVSRTRMTSLDIAGTLTFEAVDGGTRMRWFWEVTPRGGMRLLGPVIGWRGRRQERRIWRELKKVLEAPQYEAETRGAHGA